MKNLLHRPCTVEQTTLSGTFNTYNSQIHTVTAQRHILQKHRKAAGGGIYEKLYVPLFKGLGKARGRDTRRVINELALYLQGQVLYSDIVRTLSEFEGAEQSFKHRNELLFRARELLKEQKEFPDTLKFEILLLCSLNSAECMGGEEYLGKVCELSAAGLGKLRDSPFICNSLKELAVSLIKLLAAVDPVLQLSTARNWATFVKYTSSPGRTLQILKKLPLLVAHGLIPARKIDLAQATFRKCIVSDLKYIDSAVQLHSTMSMAFNLFRRTPEPTEKSYCNYRGKRCHSVVVDSALEGPSFLENNISTSYKAELLKRFYMKQGKTYEPSTPFDPANDSHMLRSNPQLRDQKKRPSTPNIGDLKLLRCLRISRRKSSATQQVNSVSISVSPQ